MIDRKVFLRVKAKSLAEEARIIRREARKHKGDMRWKLNHHRTTVVRSEARATHLALGFLRGRTHDEMERTRRTEPDWDKVGRMIARYGPHGYDWRHLCGEAQAA